MIASAIGTGLGLAGQVASLIGSSQANKDRQRLLNQRRNHIQNWFDKDYNQDFIDRPENRSAFRYLSNKLKERQQAQASANAITGASAEANVAQKEKDAEVYADAVNKAAMQGTGLKERARGLYENQMAGVDQAQQALNVERAKNFTDLGKMGTQLAGSVIQADAMGAFDKKDETEQTEA